MSDNIQINITGRLTPCLQKKIDKSTYLVEIRFSATSTQSVEDKLKRFIIHDLEHGKQCNPKKSDEYILTRQDEVSNTYSFSKSYVSYRKPRAVSTEQREQARQMMV